ncbi:aminoacyl-tRNA hydrolase [Metallumcola ferriviriculae]|uniref:Peptidyl-tRNA hydrolase n=1 Tax=Metallumcola ferriviriculae TaxID=3039180 RepID=A0AAU0UHR7_9FIRM|nr:aminoacyl-tRNA hydrolase [Desulfitibacteraceae bacterium MK1]
MKLIAGLGNPGAKYEATRHNAGFMVADLVADYLNVAINRTRWRSCYGKGRYQGQEVMVVKPQTFMNLSGEAVSEVYRYFKLSLQDLIVVYDDLDLPLGKIRIRPSGGAGGHKGLASIIQHLGSEDIVRVRVGVGRSERDDTVDYVLSVFDDEQWEVIKPALGNAAKAVTALISEPADIVMNEFNP